MLVLRPYFDFCFDPIELKLEAGLKFEDILHGFRFLDVFDDKTSIAENIFEGFHHSLEAALGAFLLRKARNSQVGFSTVLKHSEELCGEGDRADLQR